jgi:6-phosphogluconolactonase (cycloisomerase 2 family)
MHVPLRLLLAGSLVATAVAVRAATITVATTDDVSAVSCTLRDAITAANTDTAAGACSAGAGDDILDLTGFPAEDTIGLATALPDLASNIEVHGPGAKVLTVSGQNAVQVFRVTSGTVTIADLRIASGSAGRGGGVQTIGGTLTLSRVVVTQCSAFNGGGIAHDSGGLLTIEASTIAGNTTSGNSGAGIVNNESVLVLTNTTISGNVNTGTDRAGAGLLVTGGTATITNCTFAKNVGTSVEGWAIASIEGDDPPLATIHIANTILADNGGHNCLGPLVSDGHNLSDDNSCGLAATGDRQGTPADLTILFDNGGPTPTHRPGPASAAFDIGGTCPPSDQRGVERPVDGNRDGVARCDAGAFELGCEDDLSTGTACAPGTNQCIDDLCDNSTLTCEHSESTALCDDGDACTLADRCESGVCAGTPVPCPFLGSLTFGACITGETETGPTGTNACSQIEKAASFGQNSGLDNLRSIVESADGKSIYVTSGGDDAVARFDRDPATGILTYQGCITGESASDNENDACAHIDSTALDGVNSGLDALQSVAVSADGESLYAASPGDDAVARFDRDPATGALTYQDCVTGESESGPAGSIACAAIGSAAASGANSGLDDLRGVAVSVDGKSVYAVSAQDDAVARFDRDPATGVLTYQGCITGETESGPTGSNACAAIAAATPSGTDSGLDSPFALALSPDGTSLYTVSFLDDAVAHFDRDPATGALTYQGCISGEDESNAMACTPIFLPKPFGVDSGLDELFSLAMSPDGTVLYPVSLGDHAAARFARHPATGALGYGGCLTGEFANGSSFPLPMSAACTRIATATPGGTDSGLDKPRSVAVSADGRSLYVASPADDTVVHFLIEGDEIFFDACLTGETQTGPAGTNACAALASATQFGTSSGVDNPQAFVVSADGRTLYTASGNDAAVARFALAPEPTTTTTSTTSPPGTPTTTTTLPAQPISGKALLIVDGTAAKRKIVFASKDTRIDTGVGSGIDPVADGAVVQIFNDAGTGDSACLDLPAAGWVAKGKPAKRVFRYRDKAFARGPCRATLVKDAKLLKVVCLASKRPISYSLDEPAQERVAVRVRSGATEYCTVFGGSIAKDAQGKRFKAKNAPAPAVCPAPPVACP